VEVGRANFFSLTEKRGKGGQYLSSVGSRRGYVARMPMEKYIGGRKREIHLRSFENTQDRGNSKCTRKEANFIQGCRKEGNLFL